MTQHRSNSKGHNKKDPELDLSLGQVLAASGATTLGALLVKVLDMWGTLLGTAVLSICTSIGAVLILRTMRRTSETVKQQITVLSRAAETRIQTGATVDLEAETVRIEPADEADRAAEADSGGAHSRKRTLLAILVSSVSVFALTMGALFLFGTITAGNPTQYIFKEPPPSTVYISDDQDDTGQSPENTGDESGTETPDEEATGEEPTEETSADEPTEEAPTEETTTEEPTEGATDGGEDASESPAADEEEQATETPVE
ncbi:hypothetical protein [Glycomyces salinus]|uniref:hypothetical protein n=1 Tax=Glycomyces salinus TaxID=980294 RepID=UPI0018EAD3A1|nr:hypothetical protein [Glycomyces salinus]